MFWYLSGSNELSFIEYYIPTYSEFVGKNKYVNGGYGPRIFGAGKNNQFGTVAGILKAKNDSRQAVIQVFSGSDLTKATKDVPCTCTIQFLKRSGKLHAFVSMRSNDAFIGLPHDVFAFTMFQEIMARTVGCEIGAYHHSVGSLHLYEADLPKARRFLEEGVQSTVGMPAMPLGDPWNSIHWLQDVERRLRRGETGIGDTDGQDPYWVDLARLLRVKKLEDMKNRREIVREKGLMSSKIYDAFLRQRERKMGMEFPASQLKLFDEASNTSKAEDKNR